MKQEFKLALLLGAVAFALCGCRTADQAADKPVRAVAHLRPTEGNRVWGIVTFTPVANGVRVSADVLGLTPGKHGFHIHEKGDCSAPDATSAGGHFNPTGMPHGGPHSDVRHVGDFGNLVADENGRAKATFIDKHIQLDGPHSIIGRSVIVHAKEDDLKSQPSGDAGGRVACGVIEMQQ
jgi:superoxide dismutase, Cu-Zn family